MPRLDAATVRTRYRSAVQAAADRTPHEGADWKARVDFHEWRGQALALGWLLNKSTCAIGRDIHAAKAEAAKAGAP